MTRGNTSDGWLINRALTATKVKATFTAPTPRVRFLASANLASNILVE